jgi:hypothetical protein
MRAQYTRAGLPVCAAHKHAGRARADRLARVRATTAAYRRLARARGLCLICMGPLYPGNAQYCGAHVLKARERAARYRAKHAAQSAAFTFDALYGGRADMENVQPNYLDLSR